MSDNNNDDETHEEMEEEEEEDDDMSEEGNGAARQRLFDALDDDATDLDRIRSIVQSHPESVECDPNPKTNGGWCSALHMSIGVGAESGVVRYLIKRNPRAVSTKDPNGRLPLHLAVIYRARLSVVRKLVKVHPEALQEPIDDKKGHLPLHCAFLNDYTEDGGNDWITVERHGRPDVTAFLMERHPEAARARTANGHLPLHLAFADDDGNPWVEERGMAEQSVPIGVVDALLDAWPDSIFETDHQGRLALHLACRSALTPLAVIRRLVRGWPESLPRRDVDDGSFPIHHAISAGMPHRVIEYLADESPRSVREPNYHGYLALHVLLMHFRKRYSPEQGLALVQLLVSHFPASVRHKGGSEEGEEDEGSLPLHIAAEYNAPLPVLRFLVRAYREALLVKSAHGKLPLHLALWRSDAPDAIRFLVDECPPSLQVPQDGSRRLALHMAAERARSVEIVRVVHRAWPEALREKTDKGLTPLHVVAMKSYWGSAEDAVAVGLSIVRYFLDQSPRSVQETTWTGALPVHLAARGAPPGVVRLLVERGTKSLLLSRPDDDGALPLHRAVARAYGPEWALEVVQYLVETAPAALHVADCRGHLPLHESVSVPGRDHNKRVWNERRMPVVKHLVQAWPQALEVKDRSSRIPLMVAAESDASLDVLFHLLTSCPQSIGDGGGRRRHTPVPILRRSQRQRRTKRPRKSQY
jgi:ankyrin repeat protein